MDGTDSHTYTCGNADWADLLTAFDGQSITYDASGNPLSYYNGTRYTFTWSEGRRLTSAAVNGKTSTYAYDSDGLRVSKTVNGVKHEYFYASGKLLRETYGNITLDFLYNNNGYPYALNYTTGGTTTTYYYITNLQGDVLSLINASGSTVASYTYDPYGKVLTATGTMAQTNPLRYRGYYYDTETSLYYLQSRYYDPTICRFINADAFASTGQGILGHNMFAYCLSNPISYIDSAGKASIWNYLFIDSEFGFIHTLVQLHILAQYGSDYAMERRLKGYGRADIVNEKTGRVWEVKHASTIPVQRTNMAQAQALGYVGGTYTSAKYGDVTITGLGAAGTFTGSFIIACLDTQYQVTYWTPCLGVILYSVREIKVGSKIPYAEYVPKKVPQNDSKKKLLLGGLLLVGGAPFKLRLDIFDGDPSPLITPCE